MLKSVQNTKAPASLELLKVYVICDAAGGSKTRLKCSDVLQPRSGYAKTVEITKLID